MRIATLSVVEIKIESLETDIFSTQVESIVPVVDVRL